MNPDTYATWRWLDKLDALHPLYPVFYLIALWLLAWLALRLIARLLGGIRARMLARLDRDNAEHDFRRVETLMNVFRYAANIAIVVAAAMWTLSAVGISIMPLLATAGVAGIAIGFGAQSLVKDFFTGLFLLIEHQVSEGDLVDAAGKSGWVERVTLRHMRIRDYEGTVHFIPNSMITTISNRSRGFSYAVIDIEMRRQENPEQVFAMMRNICIGMRADPAFGKWILDDIDIAGIEKIGESALSLRCRIKTRPGMQGRIRNEFLLRMKAAVDDSDVVKSAG